MNHLASRTSHDHPVIAHRQHHPKRTPLIDICAPLDISLLSKISAAAILEASASVELHICICISVVSVFVKADARIKTYVDHVGEQNAIINIKDMVRLRKAPLRIEMIDQLNGLKIRAADRRQTCNFPSHSIPLLSIGTSCDPCEYKCEDTFHNHDGQCVCLGQSFECNGKCASVGISR